MPDAEVTGRRAGGHASRWPLCEGPPEFGRSYLKVWPHDLRVGTRFATEVETGCVVTSPPDGDGGFQALDSGGVQCHFHILAVVRIET